jgi:3-phenylpropionate/cinnamic acid dioxygenase small subunit
MSETDGIRNLLGRYCELMDAGDYDGVGQLFADGALADEHGTQFARGATAVAESYARTNKRHGDSPRTKHLVTNTVIELDTDGQGATARSSYLVLQATDALPLQPIITGRYRDRFTCDDGGEWRFTERRFFVDLVGDLREHLTIEL